MLRCLGAVALVLGFLYPVMQWGAPRLFNYVVTTPASHPTLPCRLEPCLRLIDCKGHPGTIFMDNDRMEYLETMNHFDGDVWVTTYPKVGTTWMQNIVTRIFDYPEVQDLMQIFDISPQPEVHMVKTSLLESANWTDGRPRVFKTHWPSRDYMTMLPLSSKVIHVYRAVDKVAVSFYHHHRNKFAFYLVDNLQWDDFFEKFLIGDIELGEYFEFVASWWERRHEPNVMHVRYEDLTEKPRETIQQVADFVGRPLSEQQLDHVVDRTSFRVMKDWESGFATQVMKFTGCFRGDHVRTGGKDKKDLLTDEQLQRLKRRYEEISKTRELPPMEHLFSK